MTLTTYRAYTMAEALTALKRDLGPDATILHTRTFRRGGLFGIGCRKIVEITASPRRLEPIVPVSKRPVALLARRTAQAREAYKTGSSGCPSSPT